MSSTVPGDTERFKSTALTLVYPPISNLEAIWVADDVEVQDRLRQSDFYMIVGRQEAFFADDSVTFDEERGILNLVVTLGGGLSTAGTVDVGAVVDEDLPETTWIHIGPKLVQIWDRPAEESGARVLQWFTPDKLLWDLSRGVPGLDGWPLRRDVSVFDLLYVGIAKTGDTYRRLIADAHATRQRVLGNEPQRRPGARATDETYLLMFRADTTFITSVDPEHQFSERDLSPPAAQKAVVADAEKAFIRLLDPPYNVQKYARYPRGKDGLYDARLTRYAYSVGEDITLLTPNGPFQGRRDGPPTHAPTGHDLIMIEGDDVRLLRPPWR